MIIEFVLKFTFTMCIKKMIETLFSCRIEAAYNFKEIRNFQQSLISNSSTKMDKLLQFGLYIFQDVELQFSNSSEERTMVKQENAFMLFLTL